MMMADKASTRYSLPTIGMRPPGHGNHCAAALPGAAFLNPPVFRTSGVNWEHRFAVHPTERAPELTAGDCLFGAGAIGDIENPQPPGWPPGYPHRQTPRPRKCARSGKWISGTPQDQLTPWPGHWQPPGDGASNQFEVFPEPVIQGPLHRPQSDVDGDATGQQQGRNDTQHRVSCRERNKSKRQPRKP